MVYNRTNIPWPIHDRVKEYADERDIALEAAYEEILTAGLESVDH